MTDEVFRPRKSPIPNQEQAVSQDQGNPVDQVQNFQSQVRGDSPAPAPKASEGAAPFQISGAVPPAFQAALAAARQQNTPVEQQLSGNDPKRGFGQMSAGGEAPVARPQQQQSQISGSSHLKDLLASLKDNAGVYEEIQLPSKGRFYDGTNGPSSGIVSIRPMTGEEEQILATPRLVKKGQAINMIFQKCIKEQFRAENLLTVDRTYLLIYLRGISYSPSYEVEIKCPECDTKFNTAIDLNNLYVDYCPDDYGPELRDVLPNSKLPFSYRLSSGRDEQEVSEHRERRIKAFGDSGADDTLLYRTSLLLNNIDGISDKNELQILLKNLPISDVSHIRNCINEPSFGVDTNVDIVCASCLAEFTLDLPLESNFFFPRRRKTKTQA